MNEFDLWLLAVALAMDCFAVSTANGIMMGEWKGKVMVQTALLFGIFQGLMPLLGWLGISTFTGYLESVDHWIAFGLLAFLGGKMIRESFLPEEERTTDPTLLKTQLILAVATSIDALAVGISFACTGYKAISQLSWPLFVIGLVSFLLSIVGSWLGIRFGEPIRKKMKPELLGGVILILIGIKILIVG